MNMAQKYLLAANGIFRTIQGEGALLGVPMVFVRLAGCSVGCAECDTDYRISDRLDARSIARSVSELADSDIEYCWITGGEPTDHDLFPLIEAINRIPRMNVCIATSGHKVIPSRGQWKYHWLSVSPHSLTQWKQRLGQEVKIVPGLNGLNASDALENITTHGACFGHYYVQPIDGGNREESLHQCLTLMKKDSRFRLTVQAHKAWRLEEKSEKLRGFPFRFSHFS
jgi:7-carboxy-7-deazaguanine synthase